MDKLLLVDGSNLLFQMFFGVPSRIINKSGKAIHGTMGFVGALLKIIRMTCPTHVAVLFDGEHKNDRVTLNADYKANRIDYSKVSADECPFTQLQDIYIALDYLEIKHAETTVCETDDWISAYTMTYGKNTKIVISSFDSDYFQLVTDNVSVLRYRGTKTTICDPEYIVGRYGIRPAQYADFKSLVGDVSDNIKGADKIGLQTAAMLLNKFLSLEGIIANADKIERPSIRYSILGNCERLKTNYKLIKLTDGAQLPFAYDKLKINSINSTTTEILRGIKLLP